MGAGSRRGDVARRHSGARRRRAAAALALMCLSAAAAQVASAAPAIVTIVSMSRLSNERTLSRWAYPNEEAIVRVSPADHARGLGRLRFLTGDGQAQIYLVLASAKLSSGGEWVRIEFPGRPNGQTGWIPRGALGAMHIVREYLLVDRARLRATLFREGRVVFTAPIGVG